MRKTIRLTGRRQLPQSSFSFHLAETAGKTVGGLAVADAQALRGFPVDAEIRVKLAENKLVEVLNFGTISKPFATANLKAASFRAPSCQVRVVSRNKSNNGMLLGSTNSWTLKTGGQPDGILLFQAAPTAPRLWRLDIRDQDYPILYVDERLKDASLWARTDPVFAACVLPHVITEVMRFILETKTMPESGWEAEWMLWADTLMTGSTPPFNDNTEEQRKWIDDLVEAFSFKHDLAQSVLTTMGEANG